MFRKAPAASIEQLEQAWQNRQVTKEPTRLGPLLRSFVRAHGLDKPSPLMELQSIWDELVGVELSKHSRVDGLWRGVLRIEVDSAAHLAELKGFVQANLLEQIRIRFDHQPVRSVRLKLGNQGWAKTTGKRRFKQKKDLSRGKIHDRE